MCIQSDYQAWIFIGSQGSSRVTQADLFLTLLVSCWSIWITWYQFRRQKVGFVEDVFHNVSTFGRLWRLNCICSRMIVQVLAHAASKIYGRWVHFLGLVFEIFVYLLQESFARYLDPCIVCGASQWASVAQALEFGTTSECRFDQFWNSTEISYFAIPY